MAVAIDNTRVAVEVTYDKDACQGDTVNVRATNPETGDVSSRDDVKNDGRFTWSYPADYAGDTEFTVTGSEGGEDTGTVSVDFS
jgi:hypothetical protein